MEHHTSHSLALSETTATTKRIQQDLQSGLNTTQVSIQDVSQAVDALGERIQRTFMSEEQCDDLKSLLEHVKQQHHTKVSSKTIDRGQSKSSQTIQTHDAELEELASDIDAQRISLQALERLSCLVEEKEKIVISSEAAAIINDIENLFFAIPIVDSIEPSKADVKGKKRMLSSEGDDRYYCNSMQYQQNVKRLKGHLATSQAVAVNDKGNVARLQS